MRALSCRHWVPRGERQDHTSLQWELCAFLHDRVGSGRFLGKLASVEFVDPYWIARVGSVEERNDDFSTAIRRAEEIIDETEARAGMPTVRDLEVK